MSKKQVNLISRNLNPDSAGYNSAKLQNQQGPNGATERSNVNFSMLVTTSSLKNSNSKSKQRVAADRPSQEASHLRKLNSDTTTGRGSSMVI